MSNYSAGDLQVSISGITSGATASIEKVIKSLSALETKIESTVKVLDGKSAIINNFFNQLSGTSANLTGIVGGAKAIGSLANAVKKLTDQQTVFATTQLEVLFNRLNKIGSGINPDAITQLAQAGRAISALSRIGNIGNIDFDKVSAGFDQLAVSITPFIEKVQQAEKSLVALQTILKSKTIRTGGGGGKSKSAFGFLNIAKWAGLYYTGRRLGRVVANIAQSGADYTETLNLWETAIGDNLDVATKFVNKMNEAYGISEKTLMKAQAIFKNMLGSLGQISDQMAYNLSEGITQMAIDYASLYNTTFDKAFEKFQSALAGQVRPIRSVSGYDITENTIYQLYQQLGGTKSVRNLSRTEKQLLGLLAIFNQMNASGALGDLAKTMESYANQARVTAEAFAEIKAYSGTILTNFLQTSGIMENLNGLLLFIGDVLKAVAESMGAIQHFGGADPFAGVEQGAQQAEDAIDKVNGKLLDFDKFRAMSSEEENVMGLDQKLLDALSGYNSILENMSMRAQEIAQNFKIASGLFDDEGNFNQDKWQNFVDTLVAFGNVLLFLTGAKLVSKITKFFTIIKDGTKLLDTGKLKLSATILVLGGLVYSITKLVQAFKEGDVGAIALYFTISGWLIGAFVALNKQMLTTMGVKISSFFAGVTKTLKEKLLPALMESTKGITATHIALSTLGSAVALTGLTMLLSSSADSAYKLTHTFIGLASAITAGAIAIALFKQNWAQALAIAGVVAGGYWAVASSMTVPQYATGASDLEGGSLFIAGEHGKTEMVYSGDNGRGNVANIQQIKQAQAQALSEWWATARNDIPAFREVSKTGIYEVVKNEKRRRGE